MADVPSNLSKMQTEELDRNSPVDENTNLRVGANINGLIDLVTAGFEVFSTPGITNWTAPDNVTQAIVVGAGGGSGGSYQGATIPGFGGLGAQPMYTVVTVVPGTSYVVNVAAGGLAGGAGGGAGQFGFAGGDSGLGTLVFWKGAPSASILGYDNSAADLTSAGNSGADECFTLAGGIYTLPGGLTKPIGSPVENNGTTGSRSLYAFGGLTYVTNNISATGGGAGFQQGGTGAQNIGPVIPATAAGVSAGGGGGFGFGANPSNGGGGFIAIKTA